MRKSGRQRIPREHLFQNEGCAGYHSYGFNKKSQITKILLFPFISALIAWLCTIAF